MKESEVIKKIQELKQIQPRKDWVVLTKNQILGDQRESLSIAETLRMIFRSKPALAGIATVLSALIVVGVFGASENALPGDFLYPVKKVAENVKIKLSPEDEKPIRQLELVNSRLEDLARVAQERQGKDLPLAYKEVQKSASQAAQKLVAEIKKPQKDTDISKKIVAKAQEYKNKKKIVEKTTSASLIGTKELDKAIGIYYETKAAAEKYIKLLKSCTLNEDKQKALENAERLYEKGDYLQALELLYDTQRTAK